MFKLLILLAIIAYTYANGVIPAAVKSNWDLNIRELHLPQEPIEPQVIEIPALELPVKIVYRSKSSSVSVQQVHQQGAKGEVESTRSEEEPHKVIHEVVRPVIQELREIIVPYRRIVQDIRPVIEEVRTNVASGQGRENNAGEGGSVRLNGGGLQGLSLGSGDRKVMDLWNSAKAAKAAAAAAASSRRA